MPESYDNNVDDNSDDSINKSDTEIVNSQFILQGTSKKKYSNSRTLCKSCPICCYLVLSIYNMHTNTYKSLYTDYKFLLMLSVTQIAYERSFSILKIIKSRIRNSLSQNNFQAFMVMAIEKKFLYKSAIKKSKMCQLKVVLKCLNLCWLRVLNLNKMYYLLRTFC